MSDSKNHSSQSHAQHNTELSDETLQMIHEIVQKDAEMHQVANVENRSALAAHDSKGVLLRPRPLAVCVIVAAVFLEPWFVPTVAAWVAGFSMLALLCLGRERIFTGIGKIWRWHMRRHPGAAENARRSFMQTREALQQKIDALPKGLSGSINLPIWQGQAETDEAEQAYAARMAKLAAEARAYPYVSTCVVKTGS